LCICFGEWALIGSFETCGGVDPLAALHIPVVDASLVELQFRVDVDAFGEFASGVLRFDKSVSVAVASTNSSSFGTHVPGVTSFANFSASFPGIFGTSVPSSSVPHRLRLLQLSMYLLNKTHFLFQTGAMLSSRVLWIPNTFLQMAPL
jgi:hypothetical protein